MPERFWLELSLTRRVFPWVFMALAFVGLLLNMDAAFVGMNVILSIFYSEMNRRHQIDYALSVKLDMIHNDLLKR
jgi:hypothetical protein